MRVFFDTEFTHLACPSLISIGLVSEDGAQAFYLECADYPRGICSNFVVQQVLPKLHATADVMLPKAALRLKLAEWIAARVSQYGSLSLVCDNHIDWELLVDILEGTPPAVHWQPLIGLFEEGEYGAAYLWYLEKHHQLIQPKLAHHALHDAQWMRHAYVLACERFGRFDEEARI
jgi:hypothetical protein